MSYSNSPHNKAEMVAMFIYTALFKASDVLQASPADITEGLRISLRDAEQALAKIKTEEPKEDADVIC